MSAAVLADVARATRLDEGPSGVERILRRIHQSEPVPLKVLAQEVRMPLPVVAAVRRELEKRGYLERRGGIVLSALGREGVATALGAVSRYNYLCPTCAGSTIVLPPELQPAVEKLSQLTARAPSVDTTLDQAPATPEAAIRRALFMYQQGAVEGKRVLILGDDDAISLAIGLIAAMLHPNGPLAARVTVLEYDERWIAFLRDAAQEEQLELEVIRADLREPLAPDLRHRFDTFETDPPYTLPGMAAFVSRGVEALSPGLGQQGFLSFGARPEHELLRLQEALTAMGLVIAQIIPNFNAYRGASILGGTSHLFHLWSTARERAATPGGAQRGGLYTGERRPTTRIYRCLHCGAEYQVGSGRQFPTIERLKETRCTRCGHDGFKLVRRLPGEGGGRSVDA
jgi:predicted methyltransferase/DNA-directed RNA polymerase subunit RPC12/RpoP